MTDVILAWLCAEDDGARSKVKEVLAEKKETLEALKATLNGKSGQIPMESRFGQLVTVY